MNIKFEIGRSHDMDTTKTKKEKKDKAPTEAELKKIANAEEKTRLQGILTEAGVEFNGTLGVTKLQALVDELEKDPEE